MKKQKSSKNRKELKRKMADVLDKNIQTLSTELQEILLDDLVTAFENRLSVLNKAQATVKLETAELAECETFQT